MGRVGRTRKMGRMEHGEQLLDCCSHGACLRHIQWVGMLVCCTFVDFAKTQTHTIPHISRLGIISLQIHAGSRVPRRLAPFDLGSIFFFFAHTSD